MIPDEEASVSSVARRLSFSVNSLRGLLQDPTTESVCKKNNWALWDVVSLKQTDFEHRLCTVFFR